LSTQKLWLTVKETAPLLGRKPSAIYEQIRTGGFPFAYRRARGDSGAIYISARDLGLIPNAQNEAAQNSATIETRNTACAIGD
jgi:helix-turn-helix protein